jgi:hypothetical protein
MRLKYDGLSSDIADLSIFKDAYAASGTRRASPGPVALRAAISGILSFQHFSAVRSAGTGSRARISASTPSIN